MNMHTRRSVFKPERLDSEALGAKQVPQAASAVSAKSYI